MMEPKFALVTLGSGTYVFLDGRRISDGIEDVNYSARDKKGALHPTVDMKINVRDFSFESGKTLEEFFEDIRKKGENLKLK